MADIDSRPRKSVAFAEGETIVDSNGAVTEQPAAETEKDTAASHSKPDAEVEEATDDFAALALASKKKKKSKSVSMIEPGEEAVEHGMDHTGEFEEPRAEVVEEQAHEEDGKDDIDDAY